MSNLKRIAEKLKNLLLPTLHKQKGPTFHLLANSLHQQQPGHSFNECLANLKTLKSNYHSNNIQPIKSNKHLSFDYFDIFYFKADYSPLPAKFNIIGTITKRNPSTPNSIDIHYFIKMKSPSNFQIVEVRHHAPFYLTLVLTSTNSASGKQKWRSISDHSTIHSPLLQFSLGDQ